MSNVLPPIKTDGVLDESLLASFRTAFDTDGRFRQSMNAVCTTSVGKIALNRGVITDNHFTFSHHLPENKATSQMSSGRCWLFAALNVLRVQAIKNMNLGDDFELSQNYLMFWDKLEKANFFLKAVEKTLDEATDSRLIQWILRDPIQDGGQWHMFTNLIRKYGVVPKTVMPESESSGATMWMNRMITTKLREYACEMRAAAQVGAKPKELDAMRAERMHEVYRMLVIHLGEPPREFEWQWRDKDKQFRRDGKTTPQEFFTKHVGVSLDDYVCLIHCPQKTKKFNAPYTVAFLGNVVGGDPIVYLNVEIDVMKKAAIRQIQDGESVWFGCDVGQHLNRELGILNLDVYDFESVYGTKPGMDKAQRLDYGHSLMTHAMVFTGVDLDDKGKPVKWRVENSWGDKVGDKGFLSMTDRWFDEFNYEVVVHRRYVPEKVLKLLKEEPIMLDPWDPMGSLAWFCQPSGY